MTKCMPFAQGRRLRVTELDACGNPNGRFVVSSGFISVALSSESVTGTTIEPVNANGDLCYSLRSKDQFTRHTAEIEFCEVDPTLFNLVTNAELVEDWQGDETGFQTLEGAAATNYALEVWMGVPGEECPPDSENPADSLGYLLLPWMNPGVLGDFTVANDAINFTVGGFTKSGSPWDVGPYDVLAQDALNTAGPLITPVHARAHAYLTWTSIPAPDPFCGAVILS
jgi:hypothetical protein